MKKNLSLTIAAIIGSGLLSVFLSAQVFAETTLSLPVGIDTGITIEQLLFRNLSHQLPIECRTKIQELSAAVEGYILTAGRPSKSDLPFAGLTHDRGRTFTKKIKTLIFDETGSGNSCFQPLTQTYLVMSMYYGFRYYMDHVSLSCSSHEDSSTALGLSLAFAVANNKIRGLDPEVRSQLRGVWIEKARGKKDYLIRGGFACQAGIAYADIFQSKKKLLGPFDVASIGLHEFDHMVQPSSSEGSLISRLLQSELSALFLASAFQAEFLKQRNAWKRLYEEYSVSNLLTPSDRPYGFQSDLKRVKKNGPMSQILLGLRGNICMDGVKENLDAPFHNILGLINSAYLNNEASEQEKASALKHFRAQAPFFNLIAPRPMDRAGLVAHVQKVFQDAKKSSLCKDAQKAIDDGQLKSWIGNSCKDKECAPIGPGSEGVRTTGDQFFPCLHSVVP